MIKLIDVQNELKAPKSKRNSFGNYNYRSCEDILEAVKPLLKKYDLMLTISDDLICVGDRFYVKATATISDGNESVSVSGYAREALTKKGMDDSQITGTASSYARKYALNGLFLIDDTKDADTDEYVAQTKSKGDTKELASVADKKNLTNLCKERGIELGTVVKQVGIKNNKEYDLMTSEQYARCLMVIKEIEEGK